MEAHSRIAAQILPCHLAANSSANWKALYEACISVEALAEPMACLIQPNAATARRTKRDGKEASSNRTKDMITRGVGLEMGDKGQFGEGDAVLY